ncbi:MAG: DUF4468 domain-containing protein [Candidatus Azobacteroides sp.]|nr:DUF4468 domain-containing protein [Candidatus Azobacteroides sp.]
MKKVLFILLFTVSQLAVFAQTEEQKKDLDLFKDLYKVEGSDVVFTKVLENIPGTKDEIYTNVLNYMAVAYKSANDVIQQKDKDAGVVIGKGNFDVLKDGNIFTTTTYNCNHTIRMDIKENRVRVMLSVNEYNVSIKDSKTTDRFDVKITETYPIVEKTKYNKKNYAKVFINLCLTVNKIFNNIESSLKNESTITSSNDW